MKLKTALAILTLSALPAIAQQPDNPYDAFLKRAKDAAGFDFTGTLARLCIVPQTAPGRDAEPPPAPARETWYTDPAKYSTISTSWAPRSIRPGRSPRAKASS